MKTIIFSDTHLSDRFEQKKFDYLYGVINSADKVIINGDFWDYYRCDFDNFMKSSWKNLFPLLKSKKASYLFGNHDHQEFADQRINLFSVKQGTIESVNLSENQKLLIRHGEDLCPGFEDRFFSTDFWKKVNKKTSMFERMNKIGDIGSKFVGVDFYNLVQKAMRTQSRIKDYIESNLKNNELFIFGHTHSPDFSLDDRYVNIGFINAGFANYLKIEDGKLDLVKEKY